VTRSRFVPRNVLRAVGWTIAAAALAYAGRAVWTQWASVRVVAGSLQPRWLLVGVASALVLAAYAVLIQTWRLLLGGWGVRLRYRDAAYLWLVSSLARYVPGAGVQIGALAVLANEQGVSGAAAASAALVSTVVNVASGAVLFTILAGPAIVDASGGRVPLRAAAGLITLGVLGLASLPFVTPVITRVVARITRRPIDAGGVTARLVALATVGNVCAWILYGVAFRVLSAALFGSPTGGAASYVAVYTASYLWGLFAFAVPAGIGAQEFALSLLMPSLAALPLAQTAVLTVAARLWRTVMETAPALLLLLSSRLRGRSVSRSNHGTS
jgi:hypothetical protein